MTKNSTPVLTLNYQDDSIALNDGVLEALDHPRQVQIMMNEDTKMLALRACEMDGEQAVVIPAEHALRVEIGGRALLRKIRRFTGWENDLPKVCVGEFIPEHRAVVFPLMQARDVRVSRDHT